MKKKFAMQAAVLLCVSGILLTTGCAGQKQARPKKGKAPFEVSIDKVFTCGSMDGEVLVVNLEVKNKMKEYLDADAVAYDITANLDGKVLENGYLPDENPNWINGAEKIPAGKTGKSQVVFDISKGATGKISLLGVTHGTEGGGQVEYLKETIDLSKVEKIVSESLYGLTVDNVLVTDNGEGTSIVILDMTFTNNAEETTSFGNAVKLKLFQNSVELKTDYIPYNHPSQNEAVEENTYLDIQKGASIQVREVYALGDTAKPIELKAIDYESYDGSAILEKEITLE